MQRWRSPAAIVLLLGLLLPAASATPAALRSSSVEASVADVDGPLVGAAWESSVPARDAGLQVDAARADLMLQRSGRSAVVGPASALPAEESEHRDSWTGLALAAIATDAGARILAWPAAEGAMAAIWGAPIAAASGDGSSTNYVRRASSSEPDFSISLEGLSVATAFVELHGDLRLVVTGMALEGTSDAGPAKVDTRRQEQTVAAGPLGQDVRQTVSWEATLDLHEAIVRMPANLLVLGQAQVSAPSLAFPSARGTIAPGIQVDGDLAVIKGKLNGLLEAGDGQVLSTVHGDLQEVRIGAAVLHPKGPALWEAAGNQALALALLITSLGLAHLAIGRRRFRRLDEAMGDRRFPEALHLSRRFHRHPWFAQDAALAAALCLTELGRPRDARSILQQARWSAARAGTRDFLLARVAARLGDRREAARLLASSLLADPGLSGPARTDTALAPIVGDLLPTPGEAYA